MFTQNKNSMFAFVEGRLPKIKISFPCSCDFRATFDLNLEAVALNPVS